ncbi:nucleoside diphosphate kinase [Holotrichia oblita]|uniref:Nucleoside diphosphate kinase n=2 Tax=Holotrichia oblita TaxID=644536 RepID=A0ACB9SQY4_HOLOL|nr:nucleoside diphosphate kinase [Holotrichia oblita]KAI4457724.1 nucleoside diphosphate kinase [Holotrichia oblita]
MNKTLRHLLLRPTNLLKYSYPLTFKRAFGDECDQSESLERSLIMIKPDGVRRVCIGKIIARLEQRGFKLIAIKMMYATDELLNQHYKDIKKKPFFPEVLSYIKSGPVIPMVWEGENIIEASRKLIGKTKPIESPPGTIRGDFWLDKDMNILHGSSSVEAAKEEIDLWFKKNEVVDWAFDWNNDK